MENVISALSGVISAKVNLTTQTAQVELNCDTISPRTICEAVEDIGFGATIIRTESDVQKFTDSSFQHRSITLKILSTCRDSSKNLSSILAGLKNVHGVLEVKNFNSDSSACITFDENITGPRAITKYFADAGIAVVVLSHSSFLLSDRMITQYHLEAKQNFISLVISILLTIPILVITMFLPMLISDDKNKLNVKLFESGLSIRSIIIILLATPVQFGVGFRFYKKAFHNLRTFHIGMDFLIATGTTAAYVFSLVGFLREISSHVSYEKDVDYCETAAVLITVVLLGKYLESYARNQTSSAIQGLTSLAASKARLVLGADINSNGDSARAAASTSTQEKCNECGPTPDIVDSNADSISQKLNEDHIKGAIISTEFMASHLAAANSASEHTAYCAVSKQNQPDELIDASLLQRGDIVRLVEGESVPADGTLLNSGLVLDEALLTGESTPIEKRCGDKLIGGSRVVRGTAMMRVSECGDCSTLGLIVTSMQEAQYSKPAIQEYADVIAGVRCYHSISSTMK